jgi:lambda family phage minor tail protein L
MPLANDVQSLNPGGIVELFVLDATVLGGSIYRFHSGTAQDMSDIVFDGNTYSAFPIDASGFELSTKGTLPRPSLRIANITGLIGALTRDLGDLVGAKVTRIRTLVKYLDAVNFSDGNPLADPSQTFPEDVYYVNRKTSENRVHIEFELASAMDLHGTKVPRRQIIQNVCTWVYRSTECTYSGGAVAKANDEATTDINQDSCGKRLSSCKLRFGETSILPYGGFPGAGLF